MAGIANLIRSVTLSRFATSVTALNSKEGYTMPSTNKSQVIPFSQPSIKDEFNRCSIMSDLQDKRTVIVDLAALLNKSLQEDDSNPSLPSLARAIIHTVEAMEEDLQDLAATAEMYATPNH